VVLLPDVGKKDVADLVFVVEVDQQVANTKLFIDTEKALDGLNIDDVYNRMQAAVEYNQTVIQKVYSAKADVVRVPNAANPVEEFKDDKSGKDVYVDVTLSIDGKVLADKIAVPIGKVLAWKGKGK
jgi:hypothetical protein